MIMAFPLAIFTAIYLSEWAPSWIAKPSRVMIELLVGIPSVVYGIFGFFALKDFFRDTVNPFIGNTLGFIPIFSNSNHGLGTGILLASTILTIMILPTVTILSIEAMKSLPHDYREASLALGANRWQTMKKIVFPAALAGIITAFILGMMRAMGETMAVVMLVGNNAHFPTSILDNAATLPGKILGDVNYYSAFPEPRAALFSIALILFLLECGMVAAVRLISAQVRRRMH
jgi:phosphate transport system permease protein